MEAGVLEKMQPLPESAHAPDPKKRDLAEESLGFSLVPSSILLWVNLVETPGEPGDCGILGRGVG